MVSTTTDTKEAANAVGGKTARACDSCIKKRARWYCTADDAFLCQSCDSSVHSANPLARRHERVRLKTASFKFLATKGNNDNVPSWPQRKARTPRPHGKPYDKKQQLVRSSTSGLHVPEAGSDDQASNEEETEQHLLYRVPIYDPFVAELCNNSGNINSFDEDNNINKCRVWSCDRDGKDHGQEGLFPLYEKDGEESFKDFLASEMELADFAADVESLLGRGAEEESTFGMEELGLVSGCSGKEENSEALGFRQDIGNGVVKEEEMMSLELGFDYDDEELSPDLCRGGEDEAEWKMKGEVGVDKKRTEVLLRLDYEAVMSAWGSKGGCPWTTGCRPHYDPDQRWPDCLGTWGTELQHPYEEHINGLGGGHPAILGDGGREARVSRYREKRRTRLFSKKIRYEVRKLNAEKRPRMKGRFVKRVTSSGISFPLLKK